MKERAKSAFIMLPLLVIVFLGGYFLIAGVIALTILALREFSAAFGEKKPAMWVFIVSLILLYATNVIRADFTLPLSVWVFVSVALCLISMFATEKRDLIHGMAGFVGVFYIIFFAFHLVLIDLNSFVHIGLRGFQFSGFNSYVWIVLMSAFGTDIFAYLFGKAIGKRKLCPSISPNKTVEGSIGGVIGSILLCGIFSLIFMRTEFWTCIVIGAAGGVFSQFGDLAASVMKRKIGIKDWGNLIPGHGGVLDRIDSVLFTAPLVYYILLLKIYIFVL